MSQKMFFVENGLTHGYVRAIYLSEVPMLEPRFKAPY